MNPNCKFNGPPFATDASPEINRATEDSEQRPIQRERASDPRLNQSNRLDWEMFALLSFVALSFAGLFIAGYIIWAKCQDQ